MNGRFLTAGRCLAWVAVALCAACASLPPPPAKPVTHAWPQPEATELGTLAAAAAPYPRLSGLRLLASGEDALATLAALADHAQRTLDLQYYLMHDDASTRALLRHVHDAAERGVRVRVLLDDLNTAWADDALICLTRHPKIELRLYNPFPAGRGSTLTRILASIRDVRRINQRMHNKLFVADNAIAVTGGRNLGDAYFVQSPASNFIDLDVIAAGPVVRDLSTSFDRFWNSDLAWPLHALVTKDPDYTGPVTGPLVPPADPVPARATVAIPDSAFARELDAGRLQLAWVPAAVLARELRARGVQLRVLTNSLAATDAPIVHVGYARYRHDLLEAGAQLHELRNQLGTPRSRFGTFGSSLASLHAKALVIDRRLLLIGSMNMDPRSARLNTEIALVMRSPALADGRLRWVGQAPGAPTVEGSEPDASMGLQFLLMLLSPFAPDELL